MTTAFGGRSSGRPYAERRLRELAARHGLAADATRSLGALLVALADESAPTTVHGPDAAVDVHLADSLVALDVHDVATASVIADLGAGAGVPGLVLAAARPDAHVHAVESAGRKCAFLERTAVAAGLANVDVICDRVESWSDGAGRCDVVCARALAPLAVVCEYAAPILAPGGLVVAWKGRVSPREAADGRAAAETLGLDAAEVRPVTPFATSEHRTLHLYRKVRATPPGFPRRPGIATKRPLTAPTRAQAPEGRSIRRSPR